MDILVSDLAINMHGNECLEVLTLVWLLLSFDNKSIIKKPPYGGFYFFGVQCCYPGIFPMVDVDVSSPPPGMTISVIPYESRD